MSGFWPNSWNNFNVAPPDTTNSQQTTYLCFTVHWLKCEMRSEITSHNFSHGALQTLLLFKCLETLDKVQSLHIWDSKLFVGGLFTEWNTRLRGFLGQTQIFHPDRWGAIYLFALCLREKREKKKKLTCHTFGWSPPPLPFEMQLFWEIFDKYFIDIFKDSNTCLDMLVTNGEDVWWGGYNDLGTHTTCTWEGYKVSWVHYPLWGYGPEDE